MASRKMNNATPVQITRNTKKPPILNELKELKKLLSEQAKRKK